MGRGGRCRRCQELDRRRLGPLRPGTVGLGAINLALGACPAGDRLRRGVGVGALLLPPLATALLPDNWRRARKLLLANIRAGPGAGCSATVVAVAFVAWVALAFAVAAWAPVRRDAGVHRLLRQ